MQLFVYIMAAFNVLNLRWLFKKHNWVWTFYSIEILQLWDEEGRNFVIKMSQCNNIHLNASNAQCMHHNSPFFIFGAKYDPDVSPWDSRVKSPSFLVVLLITWFIFATPYVCRLPVPINLCWLHSGYFFPQSSSLWLNCTDWHLCFCR